MGQIILVGIGAGVAGALLFLSSISGTSLALPLFALCALPVAIAGLAWTWLAAVVASLTAGLIVSFYLSPYLAAVYLLLFALPITWTSRLAGLWREGDPADPKSREWFPLGRILLQAAIAVAAGMIVVGIMVGFDPAELATEFTTLIGEWFAASPELGPPPTPEQIEPFVRFNVAAMPYTIAAILLFLQVFNLWLAGRIAEASGRFARPRQPLWTAELPTEAVLIFAIAVGLTFVGGGVGEAAGVAVGATGAALALIGLAVVHALTVGSSFRILILVATYVLLAITGFLILVFTLLGIAESFLKLRARKLNPAPPAT